VLVLRGLPSSEEHTRVSFGRWVCTFVLFMRQDGRLSVAHLPKLYRRLSQRQFREALKIPSKVVISSDIPHKAPHRGGLSHLQDRWSSPRHFIMHLSNDSFRIPSDHFSFQPSTRPALGCDLRGLASVGTDSPIKSVIAWSSDVKTNITRVLLTSMRGDRRHVWIS
jgi:hypothetical protein